MECSGKLAGVTKNYFTGRYNVTFELNEVCIREIEDLQKHDNLVITAKKFRRHRSLNANALMWVLLQKIADSLNCDKWEIYLQMLKKYGQFTYVCVKPEAVESVKAQWRECEEIGDLMIGNQKAVQLLCYFGSHTYNTKEFSTLLNGIVSEMEQMGLPTPTSQEMQRSLDEWESMKSIIQKERECFVCQNPLELHDHHIFGGPNRKWSEKYGLKVYLCPYHHNFSENGVHSDKNLMDYLHMLGQKAFEEKYKDKDFRKIFGKNYL